MSKDNTWRPTVGMVDRFEANTKRLTAFEIARDLKGQILSNVHTLLSDGPDIRSDLEVVIEQAIEKAELSLSENYVISDIDEIMDRVYAHLYGDDVNAERGRIRLATELEPEVERLYREAVELQASSENNRRLDIAWLNRNR